MRRFRTHMAILAAGTIALVPALIGGPASAQGGQPGSNVSHLKATKVGTFSFGGLGAGATGSFAPLRTAPSAHEQDAAAHLGRLGPKRQRHRGGAHPWRSHRFQRARSLPAVERRHGRLCRQPTPCHAARSGAVCRPG